MTLTPRHRQSLAMFEEFGWHEAPIEKATSLPVGNWAQQQTGKKGLTSGDFEAYDRKYHAMLTLFAIRLGVPVTRIRSLGQVEQSQIMADVILTRGPEFAQQFVDQSARRSMRDLDDDLSKFAGAVLWLVLRGDVPIPDRVDYFNDWTLVAARIVLHNDRELPGERYFPDGEFFRPSLREHILKAVPCGIKISGAFRDVIDHAYTTEIISRDEAIDLGFIGILVAKKFRYRQDWVDFLVSTCEITPEEILHDYDRLKQAAALDKKRVLEDLVAPVIPLLSPSQLSDLLPPALDGASPEAAAVIFETLLSKEPENQELITAIAPTVHAYASRKYSVYGKIAAELIRKWKIPQRQTAPEQTFHNDLWQPAPPLWSLPRFDIGKLSLENLETQLATIAARDKDFHDLEAERLLALLTKVANSKTKGAQRVAKTAPEAMWDSLLYQWSNEEFIPWSAPLYDDDLFVQRRNAVLANLGQIPCLLSEPTYVDFTISVSNFVSRLKKYAAHNAAVLQPDLLLALFRLDLKGNIAAAISQVKELNIDIIGVEYTQLDSTVGEVLEAYAADPVVDPGLKESFSKGRTDAITIWEPLPVQLPASLRNVSGLLPRQLRLLSCVQLFPNFGDSRARQVEWVKDKVDDELINYVPLLVNHAKPLSPAVAINLLAVARPTPEGVPAEIKEAIKLAWSRGLLQPGVPDIHYLDWHSSILGIGRFMEVTRELAEEGMLSLMWDIWVQFLRHSVESTRLLAKTNMIAANLEDFAQYVPADVAVKAVPAVHGLATRRGQSEAIYAARRTLNILPKLDRKSAPKDYFDEAAFEQMWPEDAGNKPAQEDHTTVECSWDRALKGRKALNVSLKLPSWSGTLASPTINVKEGACYGVLTIKDFDDQDSDFYARVYWDGHQLIGEPAPDPRKADRTMNLHRLPQKDLSTSLVAVAIGATATGFRPADMRWVLTALVRSNQIGTESAKIAMRKLLASPDFDPARAAYSLENDVTQLPYLWPILTEGIRFAAQQSPYPRWTSKLLMITHHYRKEIAKALDLKRMSYEEWDGVLAIADGDESDIAVKKAIQIVQTLGLQ